MIFSTRKFSLASLILAFCWSAMMGFSNPHSVRADVVITLDSVPQIPAVPDGGPWLGFVNVFDLDRTGALPAPGSYIFGSPWGFADLTANFNDGALTLGPNTIGDPDPFWYIGGGGPGALGNKWIDASSYVEVNDGVYGGMDVTFTGVVLSHTLTANHTATAWVKDFAPDYSSFNVSEVVLTPGVFSVTLATINDPTRHVQYGFSFAGENVWVTDVGPFGTVQITSIPEPGSAMILLLGAIGFVSRRRR